MRAGKLDRVIVVERLTPGTPDPATPWIPGEPTWATFATLRAQIVQASTQEFMASFGTAEKVAVVFRCRYFAGITVADRVSYESVAHNIIETKEIGRRAGLELRCEVAT